ncbi:hypothetical protein [Bacteroides oleiciplenus]|nr:hypothetical protein [Bacteroides oleiciplenus]
MNNERMKAALRRGRLYSRNCVVSRKRRGKGGVNSLSGVVVHAFLRV